MPTIKASERLGLTAPVAVVADESGWSRPSDWLTMPTLVDGDQKIIMLIAVYEHDSNFVAFKISGGNYTVDWGDGSAVESVNSGVQAERNLQWADFASATLSTWGYRQALVTIEAQSGQTLTSALLSEQNSGSVSLYYSQTLEVVCAGNSFTSVSFNGNAKSASLEQFKFVGGASFTSTSNMFNDCKSLQSVPLFDTSSVTNMSNMFQRCSAIKVVPLFDTSSATIINFMFDGCFFLNLVPLFDTSSATNMGFMFRNCWVLQEIPLLDTSAVTIINNIFNENHGLAVGALSGTKISIDYSDCKLSADSINDIFTNLGIPDSAQTINVSGNWGAATCDPSIATAISSNWTVITA